MNVETPQYRQKILLIEDAEPYRLLISTLLSPFFVVDQVATLAAGMDMLRQAAIRDEVYFCVLLDLGLPDSDIHKTFPSVARLIPAASIVIVSQHDDPQFVSNAIRWGAAGYLVKGKDDLDAADLYRAIRSAVGRADLHDGLDRAQKVLHDTEHLLRRHYSP